MRNVINGIYLKTTAIKSEMKIFGKTEGRYTIYEINARKLNRRENLDVE